MYCGYFAIFVKEIHHGLGRTSTPNCAVRQSRARERAWRTRALARQRQRSRAEHPDTPVTLSPACGTPAARPAGRAGGSGERRRHPPGERAETAGGRCPMPALARGIGASVLHFAPTHASTPFCQSGQKIAARASLIDARLQEPIAPIGSESRNRRSACCRRKSLFETPSTLFRRLPVHESHFETPAAAGLRPLQCRMCGSRAPNHRQ